MECFRLAESAKECQRSYERYLALEPGLPHSHSCAVFSWVRIDLRRELSGSFVHRILDLGWNRTCATATDSWNLAKPILIAPNVPHLREVRSGLPLLSYPVFLFPDYNPEISELMKSLGRNIFKIACNLHFEKTILFCSPAAGPNQIIQVIWIPMRFSRVNWNP